MLVGVVQMMGKIGVEGGAVAARRAGGSRRRRRARRAPSRTTTVSRLPGSWIGGSPAPPVEAPGSSRCRETSARWPGSGGVSSSICVAGAVAAAARALADDDDVAGLVEAQELREAELEALGDPGGDGQRRAALAALDLRERRGADAGALGEVAQREAHRLAQRLHARADRGRVDRLGGRRRRGCGGVLSSCRLGRGHSAAYGITDICPVSSSRGALATERAIGVRRASPGRQCSPRVDPRPIRAEQPLRGAGGGDRLAPARSRRPVAAHRRGSRLDADRPLDREGRTCHRLHRGVFAVGHERLTREAIVLARPCCAGGTRALH